MSKARVYRTIDRDVAKEIRRMHKHYPQLGHEGILRICADAGLKIDETELRHFMKEAKIKADPAGTHVSAPPMAYVWAWPPGSAHSREATDLGVDGLIDGGCDSD